MKKFFSAILLMTMMVFSVGTFVSCNDLVEEVETIKGQTTDIENAIAGLKTEIAALETALQNAKAEAADAAKKAADAAAAADAKAADAAAAAAAAQAAADALATQLETAQATLQAALDGKADVEDVEAAVKAIEALQAALDGKYDKTDAAALEARVKLLEDAVANYKTLIEELEIAVGYNLEAITNLDFAFNQFKEGEYADLAEAVAELEELVNACNTNLTNYDAAILGIVEMIQSVVYVPEYVDGMMTATGYQMGNSKSDIVVKATYEITPAKYAAELTNANVAFRAVTVGTRAAAAAETVPAEIVEAANGRVTLYARVKKNVAKKAYEALEDASSNNIPAAALALVITDEASATVDSTDVTVGTNIETDYTNVVSKGYVSVANIVKVYDNVANAFVKGNELYYAGSGIYDNVNTVKVQYADTEVKSPLAKYELRFDIQEKAMTAAEASTFLGYTVATTVANPTVTYVKADRITELTTAGNPRNVPFLVTPNYFGTTVQLAAVDKNNPLKNYVNWSAKAVLNNDGTNGIYKVNGTPVGTQAVPVTAEVIIDYTAASDVTFSTHNAAAWNYKTSAKYDAINGWSHSYVKDAVESVVTLPSGISKLTDLKLKRANGNLDDISVTAGTPTSMTNALVASYSENGQTKYLYGSFDFYALSSSVVMIKNINVPYHTQALDYVANFTLIDGNNQSYTASFTVKMGARPADVTIDLGTLNYDGTINNGVTVNKVPVVTKILAEHAPFYADLQADYNKLVNQGSSKYNDAIALVNYGFNYHNYDGTTGATAATLIGEGYNGGSQVTLATPGLGNYYGIYETAAISVNSFNNKYGSEYKINDYVYYAGVKYTFTGKVVVKKPEYGIKVKSSLINPNTLVGDVKGDVVYPKKVTNTTWADGSFALSAINLRDFVTITANGNNASENLLASKDFYLKYELVSTTGNDDNNNGRDDDLIPGVTVAQDTTHSKLTDDNKVTWDAFLNPAYKQSQSIWTSAKFKVTLVSSTAVLSNGTTPDNFGSVEFTLQIPDLVTMVANKDIESKEFEPGTTDPVTINVYKSITVKDFKGNALKGAKADALNTYWAETKTGTGSNVTYGDEWQMYNQTISVANWPGAVPTAIVESTGEELYYGNDFTVDTTTGTVTLLKTDLNIQSNILVSVPLTMYHDFADRNDATNFVTVQVRFKPASK